MSSVLSWVLLHTVLAFALGGFIGAIISGILFMFIGWTWLPVIITAALFGVVGGIRAYTYATQPWRG